MKKKSTTLVCVLLATVTLMADQFKMPEDIAEIHARESNGYKFVSKEDKEKLGKYILENWREIIKSIETLPKSDAERASDDIRFNSSVVTFSGICERLEPVEYVDFLDEFIKLYEDNKISFRAFKNTLLMGGKKEDFLSVNWAHPRVAKILQKAIELTPPEEKSFLRMLKMDAAGELADNYMTNKSDDAPLPETLPGVKLERPWGSLIRKYERITGKKIEDGWEEEITGTSRQSSRTDKRTHPGVTADTTRQNSPALRVWLITAFAILLLGASFWKLKRRPTSR